VNLGNRDVQGHEVWPSTALATRPIRGIVRGVAAIGVAALLLAGCASSANPELEAEADFDELNLAPTATTGIIRGIAVDEAIRPIEGASLVLQTEQGPREATSTANGVFGFGNLPGGTYFIQATKPGYTSAQTATEVVAGVTEPPIVKVLLILDPATAPYVTAIVWNGFLECSMRAGTGPANQGSVGVNACNGVGNQDVNFPVSGFEGKVPDLLQGELIWQSTQTFGSGLSFVVGPHSCVDIKWGRADGPSTLVIALSQDDLEAEEDFTEDDGLCYRVFSYVADESAGTVGLVTSQRFDAYFHTFYNFLPPEGWTFSVDGEPVPPT
jgi:hypothetical protein